MSKDARLTHAEVEVPATPEEVWQAIATAAGNAAWLFPAEIEGREGGAVRIDRRPFGGITPAVVTAWDPSHRLAYEEMLPAPDGSAGPHLATEFLVEARAGGTCVAHGLAREGATVHLAGRTLSTLDKVAAEIREAGGAAETAQVDALDETAVDEHADAVVARAGSIDISVNLISLGDVQGTPLSEMSLELFERPIITGTRTMFLTTRAAARHMIRQRSGVILMFGGDGGRNPIRNYYIGGFQVALGAIETLRRQLAAELGPHGIRVITLHTGGIPETIPEDYDGRDAIETMIVGATMLGRPATFEDVGNVAAFAASDKARTITAAAINITAGAVAD